MDHFGVCKLCDKNKLLKNSHIVTKNLFKGVFEEQHSVKIITAENKNHSRIMQDGFKEYLLCDECEQKFGRWENNLYKTLVDIENEKSKILDISKLTNGNLFVRGIDYNAFKKSLLSFIWRMSISSIIEFKDFNLGDLEAEFKSILMTDSPVKEWEYPVFMNKTTLQNNKPSRFVSLPDKILIYGQYKLVELVVYGFHFNIILSKEELNENQMELILRENGEFQIRVKDLGIDDEIFKRLFDDDIEKFYKF